MSETQSVGKFIVVKTIYFYLVSFVALMMVVFSLADVINMALKTWVFTKADFYGYYPEPACDPGILKTEMAIKPLSTEECDKRRVDWEKREEENRVSQRQRDAVRDISMIIVGLPLFAVHWWMIRKKEKI